MVEDKDIPGADATDCQSYAPPAASNSAPTETVRRLRPELRSVERDNGAGPATCPRCEAEVEPTGKGQCPQCGVFLPGNTVALRHGLRRYQDTGILPADIQTYLAQFKADVIVDLGGDASLTALELGLVENLGDLEAARLLLLDYALCEGVRTKRGREALKDHRATVDSWNRTAAALGTKRRPAPVQSLAEVMADE